MPRANPIKLSNETERRTGKFSFRIKRLRRLQIALIGDDFNAFLCTRLKLIFGQFFFPERLLQIYNIEVSDVIVTARRWASITTFITFSPQFACYQKANVSVNSFLLTRFLFPTELSLSNVWWFHMMYHCGSSSKLTCFWFYMLGVCKCRFMLILLHGTLFFVSAFAGFSPDFRCTSFRSVFCGCGKLHHVNSRFSSDAVVSAANMLLECKMFTSRKIRFASF
jgi:hypothetical protein